MLQRFQTILLVKYPSQGQLLPLLSPQQAPACQNCKNVKD